MNTAHARQRGPGERAKAAAEELEDPAQDPVQSPAEATALVQAVQTLHPRRLIKLEKAPWLPGTLSAGPLDNVAAAGRYGLRQAPEPLRSRRPRR